MKKVAGYVLLVLAAALFLGALKSIAEEVHYSMVGLVYTLQNGVLLSGFIAHAAGALLIPVALALWGRKLLRDAAAQS